MPYTSNLTDQEWEIIKPLLPKKKQTRPPKWSKRNILDGIFYQLKNGCNWCDLPKDLPPYSTVFWHYKQWRAEGVIEKIMVMLHGRVREQVKKKSMDNPDNDRFALQSKILVTLVLKVKGSVSTNLQMESKGI
ncbi:MAG: hypothetical protein RLZZ535_1219 [Cyanobacteriota bacterium]|jgi:transposase